MDLLIIHHNYLLSKIYYYTKINLYTLKITKIVVIRYITITFTRTNYTLCRSKCQKSYNRRDAHARKSLNHGETPIICSSLSFLPRAHFIPLNIGSFKLPLPLSRFATFRRFFFSPLSPILCFSFCQFSGRDTLRTKKGRGRKEEVSSSRWNGRHKI